MPDIPDTAPSPGPLVGYSRVDDQPETEAMVGLMDAVGRWPAARELREWEAARLALRPGDRVVDVGCGPGDVAIEMASVVRSGGAVLGRDASGVMVEVARARAARAGVTADFQVGDALHLDLPDASVDAARTERTLQWVPDPGAAVLELVRVVRPGGRVALIDTDWRTLAIDLPDRAVADLLMRAVSGVRGEAAATGGRLVNLGRDAGLADVSAVARTHVWMSWDPDAVDSPDEIFPLATVLPQVAEAGALTAKDAERCLEALRDAGRRDRLFMTLTMVGVFGRRPAA